MRQGQVTTHHLTSALEMCAAREAMQSVSPSCTIGSTSYCNTFVDKLPPVTMLHASTRAVTASLADEDRRTFEHLVARGFRETAAVR